MLAGAGAEFLAWCCVCVWDVTFGSHQRRAVASESLSLSVERFCSHRAVTSDQVLEVCFQGITALEIFAILGPQPLE